MGPVPSVIGAVLLLSGCVYGPTNGESVDIQHVQFQGFASNPGSQIDVTFYNHATESWDTLATATASSGPVTYGGQTLYPWNTAVDFNDVEDDQWPPNDYLCYWGVAVDGSCLQWIYPLAAQARIREIGGAMAFLTTFDTDGIDCVTDLVGSGDDWYAAGHKCQSSNTPTLTLHGYNPPQ